MKYIFIVNTICNIGGAELYMRQKKKYVESLGYNTIILYCNHNGDVYIPEFKENSYLFREIWYAPYCFTQKHFKYVLNRMLKTIDGDSTSIVESHWPRFSLWGELLAEKLKCKHFLYCLEETYPKLSNSMYKFLEFKLGRKEIAGINNKTLKILFGNQQIVEEDNKYVLSAYMGENVEDISSPLTFLADKQADIKIGCIGRLEKKYVKTTLDSVSDYCKQYPQKTIQLILIGGTHRQDVLQYIKEIQKDHPNLLLHVTGYIYPIPLSLLNAMSFIVAGSGSVWSPARHKMLTVSMDVFGKPIGVLGITTQNCQFRGAHDMDSDNLCDYIINITQKKYDKKDIQFPFQIYQEPQIALKPHMDFIKSSDQTKQFYETRNVIYDNKSYVFALLGINFCEKVRKIKKHCSFIN